MSRSLVNAGDFVREVATSRRLWTARRLGVAPRGLAGDVAQPVWSTRERARRAVETGKLGPAVEVVELAWDSFIRDWAPRLERAGLLVGPNWGGPDATGLAWPVAELVRVVSEVAAHEPPAG